MAKQEKIRLIYAVFLSLLIAAIGITLIAVAADIYYSGKGAGLTSSYSREIVSGRLKQLAIPLIFLIAVGIVGAVFPLVEGKVKRDKEGALKKLSARLPKGDSEEYKSAEREMKKIKTLRLAIWLAALALVLAAAIACLVYLCQTANFQNEEINPDILRMVAHILPWIAVALAGGIGVSIYNAVLVEKQIASVKKMIASGNGQLIESKTPAILQKAEAVKAIASSKITLLVIRIVLLVIAITFIILGIFNGGAADVLGKAAAICTECIGLG